MIVSTSMIMWLVLTVHTSIGGDLSTRQVFTLLSLLTTLRLSSYFFVLALLGYSEGRVAIHRIQVYIFMLFMLSRLLCIQLCMEFALYELLLNFSVIHLQQFLDSDEVASSGLDYTDLNASRGHKSTAIYPTPSIQHTSQKIKLSSNCYTDSIIIKVDNVSASWSDNPAKLVLQDIHFEVNEVSIT